MNKPILFNDSMVRAILDERKTQTRRPIKGIYFVGGKGEENDPRSWGYEDECGEYHTLVNDEPRLQIRCPYGQPGDTLWVRECWNSDWCDHVIYRADGGRYKSEPKWRPSIHMPRWASRITLEITDVRVELLQDIGEDGALAEGIEELAWDGCDLWLRMARNGGDTRDPLEAFSTLWDSIYTRKGFGWANHFVWVWVVEFELSSL